jgi:hypothetical protein
MSLTRKEQTMSEDKDTIYRDEAIEAINKSFDKETLLKCFVRKIAIDAIIQVPSADRSQGEWIAVSSYDAFGGSEELWNAHGNPTAFHYCSKCKAQSYVNEFGEELLTDYCPNCGARMKGADDE